MSEENKNPNDNDEEKEVNYENEEEEQEGILSKPVIISAEAYKTIILYASRYSNRSIPSENWKEIYGVLIGFTDDDFVHVVGAEALTFGHETDVILDNRHYVFIAEIQDKLDSQGKKLYIVGWFHSHPGLGLFFSDIDLRNQVFFQTHEDGIGLVFDHTLLGKKKQEKQEDSEFIITKYDTGFEIYRITDISMDVNSPEYSNNYYKVDYVVDGLNKYFFANVLSELSALVSEGKPLQTAYGEIQIKAKNHPTNSEQSETFSPFDFNIGSTSDDNFLTEIPMEENVNFKVDYIAQEEEQSQKENTRKELAERLIYEGNQAFNNKDAFGGIEKFRQGINHYKELKSFDKVMDLLRTVSQKCIANDHLVFAEEFGEDLFKLAKKHKNLFYKGVSNYILGYILLKKGGIDVLEEGLNRIQDAAVDFENDGDYAGAGMCFNKIGNIYQTRLNKLENACLFYRAAIENYNNAIARMHPLRTSFWNKPDLLIQKIVELRDIIEELLPKLDNVGIKKKIINDLQSISYNF
jgi:proteasome lid subunit RPN8/RPN11